MSSSEGVAERAGGSTFDRALPIVNLILLLANPLGAVGLFWLFGWHELAYKQYEMDRKRAELDTERQPHVKHEFSTKVSVVKRPSTEVLGLFQVSFTGRIANNGKFPFRCGDDAIMTARGQLDAAKLREPIALRINMPDEAGPLLWETSPPRTRVSSVSNSLLYPGEEATIEAGFLVVGSMDSYLAINYSFPIHTDPNNSNLETIPWAHVEIVRLTEATKSDEDDAKKTKK